MLWAVMFDFYIALSYTQDTWSDRHISSGLTDRNREGRKEGRKEMFYLLFNDVLNTYHLWLYCITHMVKDHSDSKRGIPLLFPISSKGSFICIIPQTG